MSQVVIAINNYDSKSSEHSFFHKENITMTSHLIQSHHQLFLISIDMKLIFARLEFLSGWMQWTNSHSNYSENIPRPARAP